MSHDTAVVILLYHKTIEEITMQEQEEGHEKNKLDMACLVPEKEHRHPCAQSSTQEGNGKQGGLRYALFTATRTMLVATIECHGKQVDKHEIEQEKGHHNAASI